MPELYERAIREELAYWPGVSVEFGRRSKHLQATLYFGGGSRFVVMPDSPSDSQRGHLNCLRDVRKELETLNAKRLVRRPKKRKRGPRVIGRQAPNRERLRAIERAPVKGDPWDALRAVEFAPPRKGHLREALRLLAGSVRRMVARWRKPCAHTLGHKGGNRNGGQ